MYTGCIIINSVSCNTATYSVSSRRASSPTVTGLAKQDREKSSSKALLTPIPKSCGRSSITTRTLRQLTYLHCFVFIVYKDRPAPVTLHCFIGVVYEKGRTARGSSFPVSMLNDFLCRLLKVVISMQRQSTVRNLATKSALTISN